MFYGSGGDSQKVMTQNRALLGKRTSLRQINTVYGSAVLLDKAKSHAPTFTKEFLTQIVSSVVLFPNLAT